MTSKSNTNDQGSKALREQFDHHFEEWIGKVPELRAEAERCGQELDFKLTTKSNMVDGEPGEVFEQRINIVVKPMSERARKARDKMASLKKRLNVT